MQSHLAQSAVEDAQIIEDMINSTAIFSIEDIRQSTCQSNLNKELGPDCFDGNLVSQNE
jgi:hypothetical protein